MESTVFPGCAEMCSLIILVRIESWQFWGVLWKYNEIFRFLLSLEFSNPPTTLPSPAKYSVGLILLAHIVEEGYAI